MSGSVILGGTEKRLVLIASVVISTAFGVALYLAGIFLQSPEIDEAISQLTVSGHIKPVWPAVPFTAQDLHYLFDDRTEFTALLSNIRDTDVHPPLHSVILWLAHTIFGSNMVAQRGISMLLTVGLWLFLLFNRRQEYDTHWPHLLIFSLIILTTPSMYFLATTGRGYAMACFFLTFAYFGVASLWERTMSGAGSPDTGWGYALSAGTGVAAGLAILTHYLATFIAVALISIACASLAGRRRWREFSYLIAGLAVPVTVAAYFLLHQYDSRPDQLEGFPGWIEMVFQIAIHLIMRIPGEMGPSFNGFLATLSATAAVVLLVLPGYVICLIQERNKRFGNVLPLLLVMTHFAGLVVLSFLFDKSLFPPKYTVFASPFAALVVAQSALWWARSGPRMALGLAIPVLIVAAQLSQIVVSLSEQPGQPWGRILRAAESASGRSLVLVDIGYGRGVPGAVLLSAAPSTRLWVVSPQRMEALASCRLAESFDALHVALGFNPATRFGIEDWLDRNAYAAGLTEQASDISDHRAFTRAPMRRDTRDCGDTD